MLRDNYTRVAEVQKIVDGDTIDVLVYCGFRRYSSERLRLARINIPEVRGEEREIRDVSVNEDEEGQPVRYCLSNKIPEGMHNYSVCYFFLEEEDFIN